MEKPKIGELITKYTWQLIAVLFFIIVMWLNSNYVTIGSFDEYEKTVNTTLTNNDIEIETDLAEHTKEYNLIINRLQALEFQSLANKGEIETLKRRLQIYIDRYGDLSNDMDENENNIIRLQTEIKFINK